MASTLSVNPQAEVIVCGGVVRTRDQGIIGEAAVDFLRQFRVDIAVIGASGIEEDGSVRDFDLQEVKVAQAIMQQAREVWLVAHARKFGRKGMVELAPLRRLHLLYTDCMPPEPYARLLHEAGVALHVAASPSTKEASP